MCVLVCDTVTHTRGRKVLAEPKEKDFSLASQRELVIISGFTVYVVFTLI